MQKVARVPTPLTHDPEDVAWALTTAEAMWNRGDRHDAVKWVRRAADAAREAKASERAEELVKAGNELAVIAEQSPSISRLDIVPRSRPPSFLPTHHTEATNIPAPPIVPMPVVDVAAVSFASAALAAASELAKAEDDAAAKASAFAKTERAEETVSASDEIDEATREVVVPERPASLPSTANSLLGLDETRPAPPVAVAEATADPPPVRAVLATVVAEVRVDETRLPATTPPPPMARPNANATAQWSVAEALARLAEAPQDLLGPERPTLESAILLPSPPVKSPPANDAAPATTLSALQDTAPIATSSAVEVEARASDAVLADTGEHAVPNDALRLPLANVGSNAIDASIEAEPVVHRRDPSRTPPSRGTTLRTSQAVHVVLWKDAHGVHVAPSGTVVSAIAIEALIVPLDPNADLSAWLLPVEG